MGATPTSRSVLVIGAGPVGLALAIELGMRGIPTTVFEQNDRTGHQPRAKSTNVRSMEHMRRWGIAESVRDAAPFPRDYPTNVTFKTRMFGKPIYTFENAFHGGKQPNAFFSEAMQWIPQYKLEAVMREHAQSFSCVELRFNCRLEQLLDDGNSAVATIRDLERETTFEHRAAYAIGADGARSAVRKIIGARLEGMYAVAQHINLVIRCSELREMMEREPAVQYWLVNPESPATTTPMDTGDLWSFGYTVGTDEAFDGDDARRRIRLAYGREVDAEILSVDPWAAHRLLASHYRSGRIFLAGDACHVHPPYGGYGMNTGLADAVDIGWKLAAVLHGWGDEGLLATYEMERRPVHERIVDEAITNHSVLPKQLEQRDLEDDGVAGETARRELATTIRATKTREFDTLGVQLGSNYSGSPIVIPDGSQAPEPHYSTYVPSAHPGCLAPHAWLEEGRSLYDLFCPDFTLLVLADGYDDAAKDLAQAARDRNLPLETRTPGDDRLQSLYGAPLAIVRPDQYVGWRGDRLPSDPGAIIDTLRGARVATVSASL